MMETISNYWSELWVKVRRKRPMVTSIEDTPLKRCLKTFDITLLGVGHMVGAGIYVLTGSVTRDIAGPAVIISFIIAAVVSLLSAMCFAEFAARIPHAGSTYTYTYITIGEFWAFVVGWNMILDMLVGMAAVARAWSGYVNGLTGYAIHNINATGVEGPLAVGHAPWTQQLDFLAAGVVVVFTLLQAIGVKNSANINSFFSMVNIFVMIFVGVYGLTFADPANWNDFMPYGVSGVLAGSASCFFAFIGLDSISISSEEAVDPGYSVPRATFYALAIVTAGYLLLTTALTLMVPYNLVSVTDALPAAFLYHGVGWARYLVSTAAIAGMSSVIYGHVYTAPRYGYAMATDGLIFSVMSRVSKRTQIPIVSTFVMGSLSALMALCWDISQLVEFLSMGTLIGYSLVAMAVLFLRYRSTLVHPDGTITKNCIGGELKHSRGFLEPLVSRLPYARVPQTSIVAFAVLCLLAALCVTQAQANSLAALILGALLISLLLLCIFLIASFEQTVPSTFAVPLCPFVPLVSIAFNSTLLSNLRPGTWARFSFWMLIGLIMYFIYGVRHSKADSDWQPMRLNEQKAAQWYHSTETVEPNPEHDNGAQEQKNDASEQESGTVEQNNHAPIKDRETEVNTSN